MAWPKAAAQGARTALTGFWRRISHAASMGPLQPSMVDRVLHNHALDYSPAFLMLDFMSRILSPYQLNPANYNPLQHVLEQSVDFDRLRALAPVKLFLSATNVRTGKVKIFTNPEITADAVMASACLPFMFQAVEIDGEAYWDGGYMGNPAIYPLIYHCDSPDVVVVHINPLERQEIPRSATEIMNRINEISFNSSLMREMRAIAFVTRLVETGAVCDQSLKRMHIHAISADAVMQKLSVMSKLNADWEFLTHLRDDGREFAGRWLAENFDRIGVEFDDRRARPLSLSRWLRRPSVEILRRPVLAGGNGHPTLERGVDESADLGLHLGGRHRVAGEEAVTVPAPDQHGAIALAAVPDVRGEIGDRVPHAPVG